MSERWIKFQGAITPGYRRVFEAIRQVEEEMPKEDDLPEIPAGVLMRKNRPEGGRVER